MPHKNEPTSKGHHLMSDEYFFKRFERELSTSYDIKNVKSNDTGCPKKTTLSENLLSSLFETLICADFWCTFCKHTDTTAV